MRAAFLFALAACGRIRFDPLGGDDGGGGEVTTMGDIGVCTSTTIVPGPVQDPNIDLSFVATDTGFTALWNVIGTGPIDGINLTRMYTPDAMTTASPRLVIDLLYESSSAAFIEGSLLCAPTQSTPPRTFIKVVNRDLSGYVETGLFADTRNVPVPFGNVGMGKDVFLVEAGGLVARELTNAWVPTGTMTPVLTGGNGTDGAIAQAGLQIVGVWTSATECRIASLPPMGSTRVVPLACKRPRLVQPGIDDFALVFERNGMIGFSRGSQSTLDSANPMHVVAGDSPRVVHDGTRFWFAWLQAGTLRAGYGTGGTLAAQLDTGLAVAPLAYELIVDSGTPVLVAITASGMVRRTLCIP